MRVRELREGLSFNSHSERFLPVLIDFVRRPHCVERPLPQGLSFYLVRRPTCSPLDQFVERPLVAGPCLQPSLKTGPLRNERFVGDLRSFISFRSADQDEAIAFLLSQRLEHCPALVIELTSPSQPSRGPTCVA